MAVEATLKAVSGKEVQLSSKPLKYLFVAEYADGSVFEQTKEDRSQREPDKRSAFYDVDHEKLFAFHLVIAENLNTICSVYLANGLFVVNGVVFRMHEMLLTDFKLIYFRQHTHSFNVQFQEQAHEVVYRLGWQAKDERGNTVERVMQIE